ncbi:MAG TPA: FAD-dependent oxidoreductase [Thermoleophilaceae bacterium]|nr:FAD-dependent oxidoreductase [Thermoleophilaceae bacterium]
MSEKPRVTIAGGGLAGLTAALRLAERGYQVKLYEQKPWLGGDLASRPAPGVELDVYPHMYLSWYHNFWRLLEDATGDHRSERFREVEGVKQLRRNEFPRFTGLTDTYSPRHLIQNLFSGVGSPADMLVFAYAGIDLLAERLNPTMRLDNVSLTGFLQARPYMTEQAARAFDSFITTVWAIPSYLTSAEDYQSYLSYSMVDHTPPFWLANGSALRQVIGPITDALEARGVEIVRGVQVSGISCTRGKVTEVRLQKAEFDESSDSWSGVGEDWGEAIDELVVAVPPSALLRLIRTGERGTRLVDAEPRLAEVSRLRSQRIPIVHLYFKKKLKHIPIDPVGLYDSNYALAFTDISQTWEDVAEFSGRTVLSLSASDPFGLPGTDDPHDDAYAMLVELAEYLDFDPGGAWRESDAIDWELTRFEPNSDAELFLNETGTDVWRPASAFDSIDNVAFAGDFCANRIGMTTIESAVTTGLQAAHAIVKRRGVGAPVEITEPDAGSGLSYVWLRYAGAPYAAAAKAWSSGGDWAGRLRHLLTPARPPARQRRAS